MDETIKQSHLRVIDALDSDEYVSRPTELIVLWNSRADRSSVISIPQLVDDHFFDLRDCYLRWMTDLFTTPFEGKPLYSVFAIRERFSFVWMSLLVEKSVWKSGNSIGNVLKLLAFERYVLCSEVRSLSISCADPAVVHALKTLCGNRRLLFVDQRRVRDRLRFRFVGRLLQYPKALAFYFREIFRLLVRSLGNKSTCEFKHTIAFFSYFAGLNVSSAQAGIFESSYWGRLVETIRGCKFTSDWFHIPVNGPLFSKGLSSEKLIDRLNRESLFSHGLIYYFVTWSLLRRVLKDYISLIRATPGAGEISSRFCPAGYDVSLWDVLEDDWNSSFYGKVCIQNCFYLNIFENLCGTMTRKDVGFFLMENQSWEKALIYAWKSEDHGPLIGVQHNFLASTDLRFSPVCGSAMSTSLLAQNPMADLIAVNGQDSWSKLIANGYSPGSLVKVEALRFLNLRDGSTVVGKTTSPTLRILVLLDYSAQAVQAQLNIVSRAIKAMASSPSVSVKPHPGSRFDVTDYLDFECEMVFQPLADLTSSYDVALCSNRSSAVAEVYFSGLPCILVGEESNIAICPLSDNLETAFTHQHLVKCLSRSLPIGGSDSVSNFFCIDPELPRWKNMLLRYRVNYEKDI